MWCPCSLVQVSEASLYLLSAFSQPYIDWHYLNCNSSQHKAAVLPLAQQQHSLHNQVSSCPTASIQLLLPAAALLRHKAP